MEIMNLTDPEDKEEFAEVRPAPKTRKDVINHPDVESDTHIGCTCSTKQVYYLKQTVAILRHADRLDSEPGWEHYELRETWPYDPPLSPTGFIHAKENAKHFKTLRQKFDFVLSSPYLRCAQTACEMAKELNIPVHFDLDLGEVFDFRVPGDVGPQHRPQEVLAQELESRYPTVRLRRDEQGKIIIRGVQQKHPEKLTRARLRFCFKVQHIVQTATSKLMNVLVVTHADALAAVVSFMQPSWNFSFIPMAAYAIAERKVKVMSEKKGKEFTGIPRQPVFGSTWRWEVQLSDRIVVDKKATLVSQRKGEMRIMRRHSSFQLLESVVSVFHMHHVLDKHLPAVPESDVAETVADDEFENLDCDGPPCEDKEDALKVLMSMEIPEGDRHLLIHGAMGLCHLGGLNVGDDDHHTCQSSHEVPAPSG